MYYPILPDLKHTHFSPKNGKPQVHTPTEAHFHTFGLKSSQPKVIFVMLTCKQFMNSINALKGRHPTQLKSYALSP